MPTNTKGFVIRNSRILAPADSPNTDGVEPMQSSDVLVSNCTISNGDDAVVVKSGSSNVWVEHSTFSYSHGATVGSVWDLDVTNVTFLDIVMYRTLNGPRVKGRQVGSANITNIRFIDVVLKEVQLGIAVDMFYGDSSPPNATHVSATQLLFRNVTGSAELAGSFECWQNRPCSDIQLDGVAIEASKSWWVCGNCSVTFGKNTVPPPVECTGH